MKKIVYSLIIIIVSGLAIQGFACSSKEMLDAKVFYERKEYDKAIDNLQRELAKNPNNEEARLYLVRIRMEQGDLREAAKIIMDTTKTMTNPKFKDQLPKYKNKLWVESYNKGITSYNQYFSTNDEAQLDSASYYFEIGSILRPTLLDFYFLRGNVLQLKGDTAASLKEYDKYVNGMKEQIAFAYNNKFQINQNIEEVKSTLSLETKVRLDTLNENNIQRTDVSGEKYFYSRWNSSTNEYELKGWRTSFPADWLDNEKLTFIEFRTDVFFILSEYYYNKGYDLNIAYDEYYSELSPEEKEKIEKDKKNLATLTESKYKSTKEKSNGHLEKALKYLELYQKIDPMNNNSNSSIIQIYKDMGKEDVALQKLDNLTKENPTNPLYWTMWADMLANLERFDDAISKYEEALKLDPNYDFALRNIASTYKNKAVKIQEEEKELKEKDEKYEINVDRYFPLIEKSIEYFEKARQTDTFKNDFMLLMELANNYIVLNKLKDEKFKQVLNDIQKVEFKVEESQKELFYTKWLKIANDTKDNTRTQYIIKKIGQLGK